MTDPSSRQPDSAAVGFRQSGNAAIVVAVDAPRWTILDVNNVYLAVTHTRRDALIGTPLFEVFPESRATTEQQGSHRVATSLQQAHAGTRVTLSVQRYDLPNPGPKAISSP